VGCQVSAAAAQVDVLFSCLTVLLALEPKADHAVVMVKFADQCRTSFSEKTRELEFTLGPETCDLRMRFGLNSGPTTAGVLRDQKSRFQLFGDTVNTAARMESTGMANFIQVSQSTADLLIAAKKEYWLEVRTEKVDVKGEGMMQTYWVDPRSALSVSSHSSVTDTTVAENVHRNERLIYWCTEVMAQLLVKVVARRETKALTRSSHRGDSSTITLHESALFAFEMDMSQHSEVGVSDRNTTGRKMFKKCNQIIDEVVEVINLPEFDATMKGVRERNIPLTSNLRKQLRELVIELSGS